MKRIVSLLLTLIIAMSLIPFAYAEESGDVFEITHLFTDASGEDYYAMVTVRNLTSSAQDGVLVVSSYSSEDEFLDFTYTDIFLPANGSNTFVAKFKSAPTSFQKVFIWDGFGTFTPLAKPLSVQFPDSIDIDSKEYSHQVTLADEQQFHYDNTYIKFSNREYKFANSVDVYVNGALYTTINAEVDPGTLLTTSQARLDAILSQAQGKIKIVRSDPDNFNFTEIHANCYQIANVYSIHRNSFSTKIEFTNIKGCIDSNAESATWDYILINHDAVQSGDVIVNVTRNGEPSDLLSICGDIIAYAVDFKNEDDLVNPKKIDIIAVSNNLVPGTVTAINKNSPYTSYDDVYTLSGTDYTMVDYYLFDPKPPLKIDDLLYITPDPFGRIYSYEYNTEPVQCGIALTSDIENNNIKILSSEGYVKTYQVDTASARNFTADFVTDKIDDETNVENRVVSFVYSCISGKIVKINKITADRDLVDVEYKSRTSLLGSGNKILPNTPIIYIDEDCDGTTLTCIPSSYSVLDKTDLIDGVEYSGYIYKNDTVVDLVVLTQIGSTLTEDSQFAVAIDTPADILTEEGDPAKCVTVLYDGEVQDLYFIKTDTTSVADSLTPGDVFFFETNSDGFVEVVYEPPFEGNTAWEDKIKADDWSYNIWDENRQIQFAQGVVTEVTSNAISFATIEQVESGYLNVTQDLDDTHEDGIASYGFSDDCVAYTYDSTMKTRVDADKYDVTSSSSIKASDFSSFDNGNGVLNDGIYQGDLMSKATTATVMIVDGEVVAIFAYERT